MTQRPPKVSVLVTAYNRERYIAASIESVLAQRFADFELIVTDNCSTDGTVEIARRYASLDARVRVVVNERNLGQFGNRNRAATLARAEYLKYHDSDDLMYPHCLDTMVRLLEAEPRAGFGLSTGRAWPGGPVPMLLTPREAYLREFAGHGLFMCGPSCALFRRSAFEQLGGFSDHGSPSDYVFWLHACARVPVLLLPADLFWYRQHPHQELASRTAQLEIARLPGVVWDALNAPGCPLAGDELEAARSALVWRVARQIVRDLRAGEVRLARLRRTHARLSPGDWVRYLRRPRPSALAGTPLDSNGDYVVPSWVRMTGA